MKPSKEFDTAPKSAAARKLPAWLALVLVFAVAGIGLLVWAASQPAYAPEVTGRPNFAIDNTLLDYGTVRNNTSVNAVFRVRNTGDQPLIITNQPHVQVVEGCCPPDVNLSSWSARPGEELTVSMTFMMHDGMDGKHDFRVLLQTNDPEHPEQELTILSNWAA
jgi:archaellum component FlaG (FlaF/FlaG flagellin family)